MSGRFSAAPVVRPVGFAVLIINALIKLSAKIRLVKFAPRLLLAPTIITPAIARLIQRFVRPVRLAVRIIIALKKIKPAAIVVVKKPKRTKIVARL